MSWRKIIGWNNDILGLKFGDQIFAWAFFVKSELDVIKFFAPDDPIQIADKIVNEKMAGTKSLAIVLDSDLRDPVTRQGNPVSLTELTSPAVLQKIDRFSSTS